MAEIVVVVVGVVAKAVVAMAVAVTVPVPVAVAMAEVLVVVGVQNTIIVRSLWCPPVFVRFVRAIGELVKVMGQGGNWQVIAHKTVLDHEAVAAWRTAMLHKPVCSGSHVASQSGGGASSGSAASQPGCGLAASAVASQPGCGLAVSAVASPPSPRSSVASLPEPFIPRCSTLKLLRSSKVLMQAADLYEMGDLIREGTFSHVFAAKRKTFSGDEQPFNLAVKRMKPGVMSEVVAEAYVLDRCQTHQHIVQLVDVFETPEKLVHLVFEHAGTDLSKMLAVASCLSSAQIRTVALGLASALGHLHSLGMIHTDVNPANVMVSADCLPWTCRLADVGCALEVTGLSSTV
jgi:hypothetical protein